MNAEATFFDGEVAAGRAVTISIAADGLRFSGAETQEQVWRFDELVAIDPPNGGQPFRMTHVRQPGARLVVRNDEFAASLAARAPQLKGGINLRKLSKAAAWIGAGIAVLAAASYLILQFAPQRLAYMLPDSWRDRVGIQIEASLTGNARHCTSPAGLAAISAVAARLAEGNPKLPPVAINIYDIPVLNAFALPGDRIVVTRELIAQAAAPEEVAGVLAHEMGHVVFRHSEAQLVRATGVQILIGMLTGGGSDTIGSIAGLAAILRYSREAEAEADGYALKSLAAAEIDPLGLKHFFELILKEEGKPSAGTFGKIESALSTHPGTEERIKKIMPLPDGVRPRPVMSDTQWRALKAICG